MRAKKEVLTSNTQTVNMSLIGENMLVNVGQFKTIQSYTQFLHVANLVIRATVGL